MPIALISFRKEIYKKKTERLQFYFVKLIESRQYSITNPIKQPLAPFVLIKSNKKLFLENTLSFFQNYYSASVNIYLIFTVTLWNLLRWSSKIF